MLLAFSAKPEELDILMLSLTFGNVEVQKYVSFCYFMDLLRPPPVHQRFGYNVASHIKGFRTDCGLTIAV